MAGFDPGGAASGDIADIAHFGGEGQPRISEAEAEAEAEEVARAGVDHGAALAAGDGAAPGNGYGAEGDEVERDFSLLTIVCKVRRLEATVRQDATHVLRLPAARCAQWRP